MSLVPISQIEYPSFAGASSGTPVALGTIALSASGFKGAMIFRAPKTGSIHKVGVRLATVTTPTDTDFRLETVSAQFPTGTLFGTTTNGTILSASLAANAMNMATLTADASVTAGDLLALVVTPSGSPNIQVSVLASTFGNYQLPYLALNNGSWATNNGVPLCAIEYSDGSYAVLQSVYPVTTLNTHTYNSGSTPDEIGARFRIPVGCRVVGGWLGVDLDNSADFVLYDSDGVTPLTTLSVTNDGRKSTSGAAPYYFNFPASPTLLANTYYYFSVKPGASSVSIYSWDVLSAAAMDQMPGGQDWHYVSAKDPSGTGSWTPILTRYPVMGLLVSGITVPDGFTGIIGGGF